MQCQTCNNTGAVYRQVRYSVVCPACGGTGIDQTVNVVAADATCKQCHGARVIITERKELDACPECAARARLDEFCQDTPAEMMLRTAMRSAERCAEMGNPMQEARWRTLVEAIRLCYPGIDAQERIT